MKRSSKHIPISINTAWYSIRIFIWLLGTTQVGYSQSKESFAEILVHANKAYEQGNLTEAINLATSCSIEKAEESDKWKAYRLLAMAYLADDQQDLARQAAENMLTLNPTYKPNKLRDPTELIRLLNSIRVLPAFSLGIALSAGSNTTFASVSKSYILSDYKKTYQAQNSFQFGLHCGYTINSHMSVDAGLLASQKAYGVSFAFAQWEIAVAEKLTYIDLPLEFRYAFFPDKKWRPYVAGGLFAGYLLFSRNDLHAAYTGADITNEMTNLDASNRRNSFNFGLTGGAGISYKLGEGVAFVQASWFQSFPNITDTDMRYKYNDIMYTYFFVDDDITLNNLSISIGYSFFLNYKIAREKSSNKNTE